MAKPSSHLEWTDGAPAKVTEPTVGKKLSGWLKGERPPFQFMNWLFFRQDEWNKYFETQTDLLIGLQSVFDYVVGVGGTHADLNALVADGGVANYSRVFVKDASTLTVIQTLSKEGLDITFGSSAHYSKGATLGIGLDVTAPNVSIRGGRFLNFDEAGGRGIRLSAGATGCMIVENRFNNCPTEIEDLGSNNLKTNNISE